MGKHLILLTFHCYRVTSQIVVFIDIIQLHVHSSSQIQPYVNHNVRGAQPLCSQYHYYILCFIRAGSA